LGELLGALGLAWPRLLLYPGGLFALLAARLLAAWLARCRGGAAAPLRRPGQPPGMAIVAAAPPLAAIALLPLAPARSFPFGIDLVVALALLEWPRLLAGPATRREALARDYGPLLVAALGMAVAVGGVELTRLLRLPAGWAERALLLAAAALWLAALPRLLAGAPAGAAHRLRALGLLLVAALPLLGALAAWAAPLLPAELAGWLLPPAALLAAGLALGGLVRLPPRALAAVELGLGALIVGLGGVLALG
jgi:hypothetical protein